MTTPLLETRALSRNFGALAAAREIAFTLEAGARRALIGPNGAGKTTFINLLTGVLRPSFGAVLLKGRDITHYSQAERVKLGIARTFQINRLFRGLSVLENVYMAVSERVGAAPSMFRPAGRRKDVIEESMHLLETVKLENDARHRISELPYGRQRLVEIAIALGLKPEVLLLDEPAAGVPSAESHIILDAVAGIAGALSAQTTLFVNQTFFNLERSATVIIILILGGYGRLYGSFIGAIAYMALAHFLSKAYPTAWQLGLGLLLIVIALFARNGILGIGERLLRRLGGRAA